MSIKVTVARSSKDVAMSFYPVETALSTVCCGCKGVFQPDVIHQCGECVNCCSCVSCRGCHETMIVEGCPACVLCRSCCKCYACYMCGACHTHRTSLCDKCGGGIRSQRGCGCCTHVGSKEVAHVKRNVNLAKYITTPDTVKHNASSRLVSAEIEICGVKDDTRYLNKALEAWDASVVGDGSLPSGGFEINTHPAAGDYWVSQVEDICDGLASAKAWVNNRAGCHTHVDARDFGYLKLAQFLRLWGCVEPAVYQMLPVNRRNSTYCEYWAMRYLKSIHGVDTVATANNITDERKLVVLYRKAILQDLYKAYSKETVLKVRGSKQTGARYRGLNLHSWFYRGTIEFRMPPGTVYPENIKNWGIMLANLLDLAAYRTPEEIKRLTQEAETAIQRYNLYTSAAEQCIASAFEPCVKLLKHLAPTIAVRDWITERIKTAVVLGTKEYHEAY